MNDYHTITGRTYRDAAKSHPYILKQYGYYIEVVHSKASQKKTIHRCVILKAKNHPDVGIQMVFVMHFASYMI